MLFLCCLRSSPIALASAVPWHRRVNRQEPLDLATLWLVASGWMPVYSCWCTTQLSHSGPLSGMASHLPGCNVPVLSHARLLSHDARRHSGPLLLSSAVPSTRSSRRTGERVGADAGRQLFAGHVFDGIGLLVLLFDCARGYG